MHGFSPGFRVLLPHRDFAPCAVFALTLEQLDRILDPRVLAGALKHSNRGNKLDRLEPGHFLVCGRHDLHLFPLGKISACFAVDGGGGRLVVGINRLLDPLAHLLERAVVHARKLAHVDVITVDMEPLLIRDQRAGAELVDYEPLGPPKLARLVPIGYLVQRLELAEILTDLFQVG